MFKGAKAKASTAVNELATAQQASVQEVGNTATEARLRNDTLQRLAQVNGNIQALDNEITNTSPYLMPLKKKDFERRIASLRAELEDIQNRFRSETERINNEAAIDQSRKSISSLSRRVAAIADRQDDSTTTPNQMPPPQSGGQGAQGHGRNEFRQLSQALSADFSRYPSTVSRELLQRHPPGSRIMSPDELAEQMGTMTVLPTGFHATSAITMPGDPSSTRVRTSMASIGSSRSIDSTQAQPHYLPLLPPSHWVRQSENQSHDPNSSRYPASQMPGHAVQSSSSGGVRDSSRVGHNRQSSMASEMSNQTTYSFGPGNTAYKAHHAHAKPDATKKDLMHKDGPRKDVTRGEEKSQAPAMARTGSLPAQSQSQSASQAPGWVARLASQQAPTSSIQLYAPTHAGVYYAAPHQQPPASSGGYAPSGQYRQQVPQGRTAGPGFQGSATPAHQVPFVPPVEPPVEQDHIGHPAYPAYAGNAQAGPSRHHAHGGHAHQAPKEYPKRT